MDVLAVHWPVRVRPVGSRRGGRSWALAGLVGCVAWLLLAPSALAAGGIGKLSGTVTSAMTKAGLGHIEVDVYEAGGAEIPVGFASTSGSGEYTVEGLAPGFYEVSFVPEYESHLNYVPQFYKDRPSFATAESVEVREGETTEEIDAELQQGGEIEGTVTGATEAEDFVPLGHVEVEVYEAGGEELPVALATSGANGKYTVVGLATGAYKVRFSVEPEGGLDYVTQFYENQSSLATANTVGVTQERTTEGIDAELQAGGEIEGVVTDAYTHAPVSNVIVAAIGPGEVLDGLGVTEASGRYTISALAGGSYKVGFQGSKYMTQYFSGASSIADATLVSAVPRRTTSGIDAALVPRAPVSTLAPSASGTPAVGQTLSCSTGSWTGSPTLSYAYSWLRDGVAIAGATASTYVVQAADVGNGLTCKVTATNKNGSAAAVSNTLIVTVPAAVPATPQAAILSAKIAVSGGTARVPITCVSANCAGTVELAERIVTRHRRGRRIASSVSTLILGRAPYALTVGHGATILVHLTRAGRGALARARHHRLLVTVLVSVRGGATARATVVLSAVAAKRRPAKHR
jgi:hypothetical protein